MSDPETWRTFIAVEASCPPRLTDVLSALGRLGRAVRPVGQANLHLTLRFLGATTPASVPDLAAAMARAAAGEGPFVSALSGLGAFPNERRPGVIWTGVDPPEAVLALERRLAAELAAAGRAPEARPFHPHVTLARVKARPPARLLEVIRAHRRERFGALPVRRMVLMRSVLCPGGARYRMLATAELAGVV